MKKRNPTKNQQNAKSEEKLRCELEKLVATSVQGCFPCRARVDHLVDEEFSWSNMGGHALLRRHAVRIGTQFLCCI
jgi:hypothetical protein